MIPFQIDFFHLSTCILNHCLFFLNLIASLFLLLNNIPLDGHTTVYLSIHLLKESWLLPTFGNYQ